MKSDSLDQRFYWAFYPGWIVVCAILFALFSHAGNPARKSGRVDDDQASVIALRDLRRIDPAQFGRYEVVHVSYAQRGETASDSRVLVLCDQPDRSALQQAVVVELSSRDGALLDVRRIDPSEAAIGAALNGLTK